jgi:hypothetical protein
MFNGHFLSIAAGISLVGLTLVLWLGTSSAAVPALTHALFATSDNCVACHSNTHAADGEDISIGYQWRATMMANAARDPYWHAAIRRETLDHPDAKAAIEDKCSTCHMPMQRFQAHANGGTGEILSYLETFRAANGVVPTQPQTDLSLSMDGVSCTVCHQIRPDNFGAEESMDGGFIIDVNTPPEQRQLFGKYEVDGGRTRVMHSATGFTPTQSDHLQRSELCAGCHTLYTAALDDQGNPAGSLPEQVPYHEWLESDYVETNSCQSCHMPMVAGEAPLSSTLGQPRPNVSRHVFVGGNAFILGLLGRYRDELGVVATTEELAASVQRTEEHLASAAARVEIGDVRQADGRLNFDVSVSNLAGHKLPTAYPARRVWLHVTVSDANGNVVFESGRPNADGSITGNDNDADGASFEPHYLQITDPGQVQIYESIMGDYAGNVTTGLIWGTHYLKDNRVPPRGFEKENVPQEVAVVGDALTDGNFMGGSDRTAFGIAIPGQGPWTVSVELLYQSIGYRWAKNLEAYDSFETNRFVRYFGENSESSTKFLASANAVSN